MTRRRLLTGLPLCLAAVVAGGCTSIHRTGSGYERRGVRLRPMRKEGEAPRDTLELAGHRLRFDSRLGVYRVVDLPDHFYLGGRFYRQSDGAWEGAASLEGPWTEIAPRRLPPGLRRPSGS